MSETAYDRWKTTPPDEYAIYCPDCGEEVIDDGYDGWECTNCEWNRCGPDPDREYDRRKEQEYFIEPEEKFYPTVYPKTEWDNEY